MRATRLLLPTVKEDPAGAEAVSHRLMVRAGLVRQLSAGVYVFLPAGWRVMQKIGAIIREEMNAIGGQEMLMPVVNPAEIWQQSGRWYDIGDELFRLKDRRGSDLALAMTHEEVVTWLAAREIQSYKQLPQIWYHIQTKERDEARPKSGVLRTREFIMKDSYTLDADVEGLEEGYARHIIAYDRIFSRCGLEFIRVESDPGMMGGATAHEYMAFSEAGEDEVVFCTECGYGANVELAVAGREPGDGEEAAGSANGAAAPAAGTDPLGGGADAEHHMREVHTPGQRTIEQVTAFLGVEPRALMKTLIVVTEAKGPLMVVVRGDQELHEGKLRRLVGEFRMATAEEVEELQGAQAGYVGPLPTQLPILADETLRAGRYATGANRNDYHVLNVTSDMFAAEFDHLHTVVAGEPCPQCERPLHRARVIEIGNIFKLGTKYSVAMGATYLDEGGQERPIVMGSYGIGLARIAAAAIEQHHDNDGIVWPKAIAPFDVHLVLVGWSDEEQRAAADRLHQELGATGFDVLYDERELSPGVKFKDADLLGCPLQVVVGKRLADGEVEVKTRASGERGVVGVDACVDAVAAALAAAP
ncbi:MAG TPA: proline--tRNA ligase [Thermoleophilia bacterium]|nr:proline--tRNA ligase [Thermoleophilia bacterium]